MPKASFPIGTMRRPSASVTSRRASGMDGGEVYQNGHGIQVHGILQSEDVVLASEQERQQDGGDDDDQRQDGRTPAADLHRFPRRFRGRRPAPVTDDRLVGDFSATVATDHAADLSRNSGRTAAISTSTRPKVQTMVAPVGRSHSTESSTPSADTMDPIAQPMARRGPMFWAYS